MVAEEVTEPPTTPKLTIITLVVVEIPEVVEVEVEAEAVAEVEVEVDVEEEVVAMEEAVEEHHRDCQRISK